MKLMKRSLRIWGLAKIVFLICRLHKPYGFSGQVQEFLCYKLHLKYYVHHERGNVNLLLLISCQCRWPQLNLLKHRKNMQYYPFIFFKSSNVDFLVICMCQQFCLLSTSGKSLYKYGIQVCFLSWEVKKSWVWYQKSIYDIGKYVLFCYQKSVTLLVSTA